MQTLRNKNKIEYKNDDDYFESNTNVYSVLLLGYIRKYVGETSHQSTN